MKEPKELALLAARALSDKKGKEIQSLLTQSEFAKLMEYVRKNKIQAFITAGNCSEVYGLWLPTSTQKKLRGTQFGPDTVLNVTEE